MSAANEVGAPVRVVRVLTSLVASVFAFDFCFWKFRGWGVAEGVFFVVLLGAILVNRAGKLRGRTRLILVLGLGAAVANLIEPGFGNTVVWLVLTLGLAGETFFVNVPGSWGRFLSQGIAMIRAPGRVFWLAGVIYSGMAQGKKGVLSTVVRGVLLAMPALILALLFGSLLAQGNAVFGVWMANVGQEVWKELLSYFDLGRIFLWLFVGMIVLPLLRPADVAVWWWSWTQRLPRFPAGPSPRPAVFSSALILVTLNSLFLAANAADALFLWSGLVLPAGVSYGEFVHQGVEFLVATVLLSAVVLTAIFQQALTVVHSKTLRVLALTWIAQNMFLILSVALRLKRYIEAYDVTVARLGVIIFLILVAAGFGLLAIKIVRDKSLSWLVGGCLLLIFATFYVVQFLDLAGWASNYNVTQWEKDRSRNLDVYYMYRLGPAAWPALARVKRFDPDNLELNRQSWKSASRKGFYQSRADFNSRNWREFYLRAWWHREDMDATK